MLTLDINLHTKHAAPFRSDGIAEPCTTWATYAEDEFHGFVVCSIFVFVCMYYYIHIYENTLTHTIHEYIMKHEACMRVKIYALSYA